MSSQGRSSLGYLRPYRTIIAGGVLCLVATNAAYIGVAVFLLVWDMLRRIRRGRYREEVNAELDAEEQARAAQAASETDDEDIDPAAPRS